MAGIIAPEAPDDQSVYAPGGYQLVQRSWMDGYAANIAGVVENNPVPAAVRWADRQWGNDDSPKLSAADANAKYGIPDVLHFDEDTSESTAQERYNRTRDDARRASIVDRSGLGWMGRLTGSLLGSAADPVNLGLSVAPEVLLGRVGLGLGASAGLAERATFYGASGAAGGAFLTPINAALARSDGRDYTTGDILSDITMGAVFGAAMPVLGAGLSRILKGRRPVATIEDPIHAPVQATHVTPEAQLESLSTVLRQKMIGLPADVSQVVNLNGYAGNALRTATKTLVDASENAAQVLDRTVGGVSTTTSRRAELAPIGEAGSSMRDMHTLVGWQPSDVGNVSAADLRNIPNIVQRMAPVEMTETGALWRTVRDSDGRVIETRLSTDTVNGRPQERYTQTVVSKKAGPLSKFIDTEVRAPGAYAEQGGAQFVNAEAQPPLQANPDDIQATLQGYRAGETSPYPSRVLSSQTPEVTPVRDSNALQEMEDAIASAPKGAVSPNSVIGEATPALREIEAINKDQDELIQALKAGGKLSDEDLKTLDSGSGNEQYFKDVAQARAQALDCLMTYASEA